MRFSVILILILPLLIFAQDLEGERQEHLQRLEQLRSEIEEAEWLANQAEQEKAEIADQLAALDRKISARKRLLEGLEKDLSLTERELSDARKKLQRVRRESNSLSGKIDSLGNVIAELRELVAARAVYVYKHWRSDELTLILTSEDFNQALVRKKYFNAIARQDRKNMELLDSKKRLMGGLLVDKRSNEATLEATQRRLQEGIRHKNDLIAESRKENETLQSERSKKAKLMEQVKRDHASILQNLADKRQAALEMENLIAALEKRAAEAKDISKLFPDLNLVDMKGEMEWPVSGEIISSFGRQKNPYLNTWTENTGIDIRAEAGSGVRAVASGRVTVITWLRGYGSTLIVSHPGDFYTVYTHLEDILVNPGNLVKAGSVIGTVGDSGSLDGPKLHFEIWEKKAKHNPEEWFKKRG